MENKTKELLSKVSENRLDRALASGNPDDAKAAFKEAMEAVDRQIELTKLELSHDEQIKKEELRVKEAKVDRWIRIGEIVAVSILSPLIGYGIKRGLTKLVCTYEKTDSFTMTPGKSGIGSFFRFKD